MNDKVGEKSMNNNENIELKRLIDILKSSIVLVILILIISVMLGYFYSYYYVVPKYKATSTLLLIPNATAENSSITYSDLVLNSELISTYSNIAKQSRVLKKTISNLGLNITEAELLNSMQVSNVKDTYVIQIAITSTNPELAMNIAKELSNVFLSEIKSIYNLDNIGIVDEAEVPTIPYNINHVKDLMTFGAGGLMLSGIGIVIIYILDNTAKTEEDIERYIRLKALGKVPVSSHVNDKIINTGNAKFYITECINTIRTNILYMNSVKGSKTILVTSCMAQEGKSFVSSNIAVSFAESNKKVLLIDCDMRKGRAHKIFNVENTEGLSNYLYAMTGNMKEDILLAEKYIKETEVPNLHILSNGAIPPNPSELIDSNMMKELIAIAKNMYDIIIIDSPPCKLVTDSIILSTIVDSTVLVANSEKTKINDLKEVKKSIENVGGKLIGGIINNVKVAKKTYGKTYYYGHSNENSNENSKENEEKETVTVKELINETIESSENEDILFDSNIESERTDNTQAIDDEKTKIELKENAVILKNINTNSNKNELDLIAKQVKTVDKTISKDIKTVQKILGSQINKILQNNEETIHEIELNQKQYIEEIQRAVEDIKNNVLVENVRKEGLTQEQIQEIIKNEMSQMDYIEQMKQINEMSQMNYLEQMKQINEKITSLQDNYLELSKNLNNKNEEEEKVDSRKIIDFKLFNKQDNKKKGVYTLDEEIPYEDLEKTACYILPIETDEEENTMESEESYTSKIASN